jgi:hypothetical protein
MRAVRRLTAAAAAGILGLMVLAPPASAADPMVEWTRPSLEDSILEEPGFLTGTITGEETQTIESLEVEITNVAEDTPDQPCVVEDPPTKVLGGTSSESFELDLEFPCNGTYEIEGTVGFRDTAGVVGAVVPSSETTIASVTFSVAIPPTRVEGFETTYDEGTKEVRLNWAPNAEADLIGYYVERNPPGPEGFSRITPDPLGPDQTSFTDPGIEDEHRYRVVAVRRGPRTDSQIQGEPSSVVAAGPERTEPTLPDDISAPNSRPPASAGGSGGGGSTQRATRAPSPSRPNSNIFEETLPFDPSQTTLPPPTTEPPEDAAVLAEFDDEPTQDDRRATLVPVAGGLALLVGAMHLFLLSKRAGEPEDIPMSRV